MAALGRPATMPNCFAPAYFIDYVNPAIVAEKESFAFFKVQCPNLLDISVVHTKTLFWTEGGARYRRADERIKTRLSQPCLQQQFAWTVFLSTPFMKSTNRRIYARTGTQYKYFWFLCLSHIYWSTAVYYYTRTRVRSCWSNQINLFHKKMVSSLLLKKGENSFTILVTY